MSAHKHVQNNLAPIVLKEGEPGYNTAKDLKEKLADSNVFNIAITGPYGSGKSTILNTLKDIDKNHNYLSISLASLTGDMDNRKNNPNTDYNDNGLRDNISFDNTNDEANEDNHSSNKGQATFKDDSVYKINIDQHKIEFSILQQLIYRENPETLPSSRFPRFLNKSSIDIWKTGFYFVTFIVCLLIVFEPSKLRVDTFYSVFNFGQRWNTIIDILCSGCLLVYILFLFVHIYKKWSYGKIKVLGIKDFNVIIDPNSSVFNKHLDEIIYFFESTNYDVVIIEDLDRFNCPDLFYKLREINFILRNSKVLQKEKRIIKFIYAVKDDLFTGSDRTKFFDYIATVIPIVNPNNSCEKLSQELNERGYELDKSKLLDLCEYVDDMRIVKNVANEFQQYMERLENITSPDILKLLAIIIYKNYHPDDFGKLHYKKGKVYEFINLKPYWIQLVTDKIIKPKLEIWEKEKEDYHNANKFKLKQWRILYMEKLSEHLRSNLIDIFVNNKYYDIKSIIESEDLFENLINHEDVSYHYCLMRSSSVNRDTSIINFEKIQKEVGDELGYLKIKEKINESLPSIENEIRMIRMEESRLKNYRLSELLVQFPEIKNDNKYVEIGLSPLMEHFLQLGYIDETYYDYLTIYDGTYLSLNDRTLLSRIKQNSTDVKYDDSIDNVETLVHNIPLFAFRYKSIFNYKIIDFLYEHAVLNEPAIDALENHFFNNLMPPLDFMGNYYKNGGSGVKPLWKSFIKSESSWSKIQSQDTVDLWDTLVEAWLKYCESTDIIDPIIDWLNSNLGFCIERRNSLGIQHIKEIIDRCKFEDISSVGLVEGVMPDDEIRDIADYIINKRLFVLSSNNICTVCDLSTHPFVEVHKPEKISLTQIFQSGNQNFKDYVIDYLPLIINNCLSNSSGQEEENELLFIINNSTIEEKVKKDYLKKQSKFKINSIKDVDDDYRLLAFEVNIVAPTWQNIIDQYTSDKKIIHAVLEDFVDNNCDSLRKFPMVSDSDVASEFVGEMAYGNHFKIDTLKLLLPVISPSVKKEYESIFSEDVSTSRVKLLIDAKLLSGNLRTAKIVKEFSPNLYPFYLYNNIEDLINNFDSYEPAPNDLSIIISETISHNSERLLPLVKCIPADLINRNSKLADNVLLAIQDNIKDFSWSIIDAVLRTATQNETKLNFQKAIIKQYQDDNEKIRCVLKTMPSPYFDILDVTTHPKVPLSFKDSLEILRTRGFISSYKEQDNEYRVYHGKK